MATLSKGNLFDPQLVSDLIKQGKRKIFISCFISQQTPIPFNGQKEFTFTMDSEIDIVAEKRSERLMVEYLWHQGTIIPIKVEYGARVSDEFMYAAAGRQNKHFKGI